MDVSHTFWSESLCGTGSFIELGADQMGRVHSLNGYALRYFGGSVVADCCAYILIAHDFTRMAQDSARTESKHINNVMNIVCIQFVA